MNSFLLAVTDAQKALDQGKGLFEQAKGWCYEHWYVSIPGAFIACFVVMWMWAKHKWNQ